MPPKKGSAHKIAGAYEVAGAHRIAGAYPIAGASIPYDFGTHEGGMISTKDDRQDIDDDIFQIILGRLNRIEQVLKLSEYSNPDHAKYLQMLLREDEEQLQKEKQQKPKRQSKAGTIHKAADKSNVQQRLSPGMLF